MVDYNYRSLAVERTKSASGRVLSDEAERVCGYWTIGRYCKECLVGVLGGSIQGGYDTCIVRHTEEATQIASRGLLRCCPLFTDSTSYECTRTKAEIATDDRLV